MSGFRLLSFDIQGNNKTRQVNNQRITLHAYNEWICRGHYLRNTSNSLTCYSYLLGRACLIYQHIKLWRFLKPVPLCPWISSQSFRILYCLFNFMNNDIFSTLESKVYVTTHDTKKKKDGCLLTLISEQLLKYCNWMTRN